MRVLSPISRGTALAVALAASLAAVEAGAAGYFNVPSSGPQCLGYGSGPGYHANLLLGPSYKAGGAAKSVRRLRAPFHPAHAPPVNADFGAMSTWRVPTPPPSPGLEAIPPGEELVAPRR